MNDKGLLMMAAKAAGIRLHIWGLKGRENFADISDDGDHKLWNPLEDDGDALRLAVKLGILEMHRELQGRILEEQRFHDRATATRRAIVRVAAAIGGAA